jgi:hypothetical protein
MGPDVHQAVVTSALCWIVSQEPDLRGGEDCERGRPLRGKLSIGREISQSNCGDNCGDMSNCGEASLPANWRKSGVHALTENRPLEDSRDWFAA